MLENIITSKTRIKIITRLFLNPNQESYLREMEKEMHENPNAIRVELNRLEKAKLIIGKQVGKIKLFHANTEHPMFQDLNNILKKTLGIDQLINKVVTRIGGLEAAYVIGDIAEGKNAENIDVVLIGENMDLAYISELVKKGESLINRKVRYMVLSSDLMASYFEGKPSLLIWQKEVELVSDAVTGRSVDGETLRR